MKKKILSLLLMFVMLFTTSMYAQERTPLEPQPFYKTMYIGFGADVHGLPSANYNGFDKFKNTIGGGLNLRVGKNITPKFGVETEFLLSVPNDNERFNGPFNYIDVGLNFTTNMNNIIHGYKGRPDKFEVVPFVGLGWERYLHDNYANLSSDIYGKGGIQLNANLSKHWQLNVIPYVQYRLSNSNKAFEYDNPRFTVNNLKTGLEFGFTYKFGDFKYSNLKYTQAEYDAINDEVNRQRFAKEQADEQCKRLFNENTELNHEIDELNSREMVNNYNIMPVIQFTIGKSIIEPTQHASLEQIANFMKDNQDVQVTIVGHADAETGTPERNEYLAKERAEHVRNVLVNMGVNKDQLVVVSKGATVQPFNENDANRAVIFTETK